LDSSAEEIEGLPSQIPREAFCKLNPDSQQALEFNEMGIPRQMENWPHLNTANNEMTISKKSHQF